ncbi:MAG: hypothetical protein HQL46_13630 [Gammaproteobacteria bacterium]|nr:hypothetical protein [Gammaproteobacteria bacterium]
MKHLKIIWDNRYLLNALLITLCLISSSSVFAVGFTTTSTADTTAPIISSPQSVSINSTQTQISWTTDEITNTQTKLEENSSGVFIVDGDLAYATSHSMLLTKLEPSTPYRVEVIATDISGNKSTPSTFIDFTTRAISDDPVNGVCGSSHDSTLSNEPTTNLCSTGVSSTVSGTGPWTWTCSGINDGTNASCTANLQYVAPPPVTPINASCGSSHNNYFSSQPSSNLCSSGNTGNLTGTGPWAWSCLGINGGSSSNCRAYLLPSTPTSRSEIEQSPTEGDVNHNSYYLLQLSTNLGSHVTVDYKTEDGTAIAGQDYIATSGTVTISAGEKSVAVAIEIIGDTTPENNEEFYLVLSNPNGIQFPNGVTEIKAKRTIIDDD